MQIPLPLSPATLYEKQKSKNKKFLLTQKDPLTTSVKQFNQTISITLLTDISKAKCKFIDGLIFRNESRINVKLPAECKHK